MRHPHLDFAIPSRFVALLDWLLADYRGGRYDRPFDAAERKTCGVLYDIDSYLLGARVSLAPERGVPQMELVYENHPREVIPFAHNGGDGLVYAWALLAPELELDELPCVSFAPVDSAGARWLGDDTREALENLLIGRLRDAERFYPEEPAPTTLAAWSALCDAFDLRPDPSRSEITAGARSKRPMVPAIPEGWRFVPTDDGIGVLAPKSAFAGEPLTSAAVDGEEGTLALATTHLRAGHAASALVVLKEGFYEDSPKRLVELEAEAFLALGRPVLAARAARWLELFEQYPR